MTYIVMAIFIIIGATLQSVSPAFSILGMAKFPILLSIAIYYALNRDTTSMLAAAAITGFVHDALSLTHPGYSSLTFIITGWIISRYRGLVMEDSFMTPVVFGAIGGGMVTFMQSLLLLHDKLIPSQFLWISLHITGVAALCAIITPITFILIRFVDKAVNNIKTQEKQSELF